MLTRCVEGRAQQPEAMSKVQVVRACQYIERHCTEAFDLERLAAACGASKSSICHALPLSLGITPRELHSVLRVRRAKELLASGVPPADAVTRTGFSDQPQLTRQFKRIWGVTPGRYARMTNAVHLEPVDARRLETE
jgi:methylphosphotriester-DNA--protein-cysteine methyltransferase